MVSPGLTVILLIDPVIITLCALAAGASQNAEIKAITRAGVTRAPNKKFFLAFFIAFLLRMQAVARRFRTIEPVGHKPCFVLCLGLARPSICLGHRGRTVYPAVRRCHEGANTTTGSWSGPAGGECGGRDDHPRP